MSAQRHLLGLVLMAGSLAPIAAGAYALRRRFLPAWWGAPARLAEAVIGLATVVLVLQAVGSIAFEVLPVVAGLVLAGGALLLAARWPAEAADEPDAPAPQPPAEDRQPVDRMASVVTVVAVAVVVGAWISRVSASVRLGMRQTDALYYHLPAAVRFVQDGAIAPLRVFSDEPLATFLPLNSSLMHGFGMLLLGDDVLSPYVNLGWLALALLAGWCVGVPYGAARLTLLATTVVLGAPGVVSTQAGEALNDIAAAALILTAVALLANAPRDHGVLPAHLLAATAAGLAAGSKVTVLPILVVLAVAGVWVAPAGRRRLAALGWTIGYLVGGGYWYLRNLVLAGNPLPTLDLALGPVRLDEQPSRARLTPLSDYLLTGDHWGDIFVPGLERFLGPAWWIVLPAAVAGAVAVVVRGRDATARAIGVVAALAILSHLVTPQNNEWVNRAPVFFLANLRYTLPALLLGLVAVPLVRGAAVGRAARVLVFAFAGLLAIGQLDGVWSTAAADGGARTADLALGLAVGLVVALVLVAIRRPAPRVLAGVAAAALAVLVLADGRLDGDRYQTVEPMPGIYAWARQAEDQRIALVGDNRQYPLTGRDLSNQVRYLARNRDGLDIAPIRSCAEWRRALNRGDFDYVVLAPSLFPKLETGRPTELAWTTDPAVTLVRREQDRLVFGDREISLLRIDGPLTSPCP